MAKLRRIKITAVLSGLSLEADLQNVYGSATHREKVKGVPKKRSRETSSSAHVGHAMIALIEGNAPELQFVYLINYLLFNLLGTIGWKPYVLRMICRQSEK